MDNKINLYYYHVRTEHKDIIKGEFNKQTSKFMYYIMKFNGENKIEFKIPLIMKDLKLDICFIIDFKNYLVSMKSNDQKYSEFNKHNSVKLSWTMAHNKNSEIFYDDNKKNVFDIYDKINVKYFSEIKRPIRAQIKKSIFNKIFSINFFFEEVYLKEANSCLKFEEFFIKMKICFRDLISSNYVDESKNTSIENLSKNLKIELLLKIEEIKKLILDVKRRIENLISLTFYKNEFSHIVEETFNYEEYNNNENKSASFSPASIYSVNFYNFKKKSEIVFILKNLNNSLVFMKNQSEYFSYKNTTDDQTLNISKNDDGFNFTYKNIIFNHVATKNYFYFGESNNSEKKEGFGFEGYYDSPTVKINNETVNFYIGNFKNNLYDGYGVLDCKKYFYKGDFLSGKKSGKCEIFVKEDCEMYIGEIKQNVLEGKGNYMYNSESQELLYEGDFQSNQPSGHGKIIYKNFDTFEGEFYLHSKINQGVYTNQVKDKLIINYDEKGEEFTQK